VGKRRKKESAFRFSPEKFLDKTTMRGNLILSSLYLFLFEVLKFAIMEDVKDFIMEDVEDSLTLTPSLEDAMGEITTWEAMFEESEHRQARVAAAYKKRLGDLHKKKWKASCLFLEAIGVLDKQDVDDLGTIEAHRNEIAHELPRLLTAEDLDVNLKHLVCMREILGKIEAWNVSIEVAIYPELEGKGIRSSRIVVADHIVSVALSAIIGDDGESAA
jgi:hypothetical protein